MPRLSSELPEGLRPYLFHGVDLTWGKSDKNAVGECPWCGTEGKFSVLLETGVARCWSCGVGSDKGGMNALLFIRSLQADSFESTNDYEQLATNRGLLNSDTLISWQVAKSVITRDWIVPGYGADGKMNTLYKYGRKLIPTPTLGHHLFGVNLFDKSKEEVFVCEGPWDAQVLWELVGKTHNVLAVPGCNVFSDQWVKLFAGKIVTLLYDNDHPKKNPNSKQASIPAGYAGMERVAGMLTAAKNPPVEIRYLKWGKNGYDPKLPSGTDLRDVICTQTDLESRLTAFEGVLSRVTAIPKEWLREASTASQQLKPLKCVKYRTLANSWRKALKWTPGLDRALVVMLASVISTKTLGDQLWIKVIGPASSGKSTLCEAISVAHKYVLAKSTIRGFHSGFSSKGDSEKDNSLIVQVMDKTLVTKDGDTLLQSPNLGQILAEARDIYDRTGRTHYRNDKSREYTGINMTWILCGTSSLRSIDSSELGERFLDCVIMDGIDDELEDEILWRAVNQADRTVSIEADGSPDTFQEKDMTACMRLTGGYVNYLRENAGSLIAAVETPEWVLRRCTRLGKFVAFMRARPSQRQAENVEREFAARLVKQHMRLAKCLAAVLNKTEIDKQVMGLTTAVALDTSRGQTLDLMRYMDDRVDDSDGCGVRELHLYSHLSEHRTKTLLKFLYRLGAVEHFEVESKGRIKRTQVRWRMSKKMRALYKDVVDA